MIELIREMFHYPFMLRAFFAGTLIALCASLLGVCLVLKRYSMIGDGLSHVGFGALALASVLNIAPFALSIPVVIVGAVIMQKISSSGKIGGDAAIALLSTSAMAFGVMIISMTEGMNVDVYNYLFGSILSMSRSDVLLSAALSAVILILYAFCYNRIFSVVFDEEFTQATGTDAKMYNLLISVITAVIIVLGMKMMGALLISSLIVFPSLTSMRVCKTFKSVVISSAVVSVICLWIGITISYLSAAPAGASIVLCNVAAFIAYSLVSVARRRRKT